jgi:hypothetical protein
MAHYMELWSTNGLVLNLMDGTNYKVQAASGLGTPDVDNVMAAGWQADRERIIAYNVRNRHVELPVTIMATTRDGWNAAYQDLARVLRDAKDGTAQAWLNVHFDGATYPLLFDVEGGEIIDAQQLDHVYQLHYLTAFRPVVLHLRPYGHPQALGYQESGTITNGDDANGEWTMTALAGERRTPTRLQMVGSITGVVLARTQGARGANLPWVLDCEDGGTHPAYTVTDIEASADYSMADAAVAAAQNGAVARVTLSASSPTSAALIRWGIAKPRTLAGRYHVWGRLDGTNQAGGSSVSAIKLTAKYGGTGSDFTASEGEVTVNTSGSYVDRLVYLGAVEMAANVTTFNMELWFGVTWNASGTCSIDLDCLYLLPADEYVAKVVHNGSGVAIVELDGIGGYLQPTFRTSAGAIDPRTITVAEAPTPWLGVDGAPVWYPLLIAGAPLDGKQGSHDLTATITMRAWYEDLYELVK